MTPTEPVVRLITEVGPSSDGSGRTVVRILGVRASPGALPSDRMARLEASIGMEYPVEQLDPFFEGKTSQAIDATTDLTVFEPGELERVLKRIGHKPSVPEAPPPPAHPEM